MVAQGSMTMRIAVEVSCKDVLVAESKCPKFPRRHFLLPAKTLKAQISERHQRYLYWF